MPFNYYIIRRTKNISKEITQVQVKSPHWIPYYKIRVAF